MQEKPKYWRGLEELENTPEFIQAAKNEFPEFLPIKEKRSDKEAPAAINQRRDFLKLLGFGVAAATLSSCEAPVRKAIPYLNKPAEIEPGISNFYASTYFTGSDYVSIMVETREGRPIKIEGNNLSALTQGGTSARAQGSVLEVYDTARLQGPIANKEETTWEAIDQQIRAALGAVRGKVVFVSDTIISPSTKRLIRAFGTGFGNFEHVVYDQNSAYALLLANGGVVPGYDFSKAQVIVSIGADFLGTWISPVEFAAHYIVNRKVGPDNPTMSRHYQFETLMTITGAKADVRVPVKATEQAQVVAALYQLIVGGGGQAGAFATNKAVAAAAAELLANRGNSLVVAGSNDPEVQILVTAINEALGNVGTTILPTSPLYVRQGNDAQMIQFVKELNAGTIGAVMFYGANPVYDHPLAEEIVAGLQKVPLSISFSETLNETAAHVKFICPDHHYLQSWNDYEPRRGFFSFAQPTITPIFNTRQMQDSLLVWSNSTQDYYAFMQDTWRSLAPAGDFQTFWNLAIHNGVYEPGAAAPATETPARIGAAALATPIAAAAAATAINNRRPAGQGVELVIYEKVTIGTGKHANNPFLQETPDPITRATWDNYLTIPQSMAVEMEVEQNDVIRIIPLNGEPVEAPALIQPGQAPGTVGIALGYGRNRAGKVGDKVGSNAYPLLPIQSNAVAYWNVVNLEKTGADRPIAQIQTHHTIMGRRIVQEATLTQYREDPTQVTEYIKIATPGGAKDPAEVSLWQDYQYNNHHWGMVIDLNSCIGCHACVVACRVENNVPVVGKQEVLNRREMDWLRIDRYYSHAEGADDGDRGAMEHPAENPSVIFQPMLCQHCNHAPCETVCPVLATTHSSEGLSQMTYNRCVGTRYCANNCPYKVRRFNWFSYVDNVDFREQNFGIQSDLGRMVLNPDVTVRARGVMEKCSFCVQRIQQGKLQAKREKRRTQDPDVITACAQACPTDAIVFGDMLDQNSTVSQILARQKGERAFHVLAELNTQPNVTYLTLIRNLA
jgi:MoCo/4Fe-4S cofactor protein with predicted Tat translocation signal